MRNHIHNIDKKSITLKISQKTNTIDKIYVISFKDDTIKKNHISKYLKAYNISFIFIDAVDGRKDPELLKKYEEYLSWSFDDERSHKVEGSYKKKLVVGSGAFGLLESYKKVFTDAIKNKHSNIMVFEDDILLDNNFNEILQKFLTNITKFDLVYLGCSQYVWRDINTENIPNTNSYYYTAPLIIDGSFAIIYNQKVYNDIIDLIERYNAPYDLYLRHITKHKNSYVIYPNIAIADTTSTSRISGLARNLRHHADKVHWKLNNINFSGCQLITSILMANFNNEKTLEYSLNSIINQTYSSTEIVIVDDNSTDQSVNIIKKWIDNNKNIKIKLIELKNNVGAYKCRNIALKECSGFFVTILDPDDVFLSKKLEHDIYNYFNWPNHEVFFSRMYRSKNIKIEDFKIENLLLQKIADERELNKINSVDKTRYPWDYQYRFGMPTIFVEKIFFEKYGKWRDDYRYGMDIELIQRYLIKKHKTYLDNQALFKNIHTYQSSEYGIYCSSQMSYVSFPMNKNNATNFCLSEDRKFIHTHTNLDLQKLLK